MPSSNPHSDSASSPVRARSWRFTVLLTVVAPVLAAIVVYQLDSFEPAHIPVEEWTYPPLTASMSNDRMLRGSEVVGRGVLPGPEDVVYDSKSKLIYTGCVDGWIKRVTVNDSVENMVVENWVNTGGRPLGLALGNDALIIADADKGLLKIVGNKTELLTEEAEGRKFKLTDGVDIADDGMIYFTDASYKYTVSESIWDVLEGKPYGRFMSFDPVSRKTRVLLSDLYFPNGVALSPDQDYAVFCETPLRRCRKYYIRGQKSGQVEKFIDNLPGLPDNIHYDGEGHYLIALPMGLTKFWDLLFRYPFIRKIAGIMERYIGLPRWENNAGILVVDLEGTLVSRYYDPGLILITSGIKIGDHLYCGSVYYPHILRLDLNKYPARAAV